MLLVKLTSAQVRVENETRFYAGYSYGILGFYDINDLSYDGFYLTAHELDFGYYINPFWQLELNMKYSGNKREDSFYSQGVFVERGTKFNISQVSFKVNRKLNGNNNRDMVYVGFGATKIFGNSLGKNNIDTLEYTTEWNGNSMGVSLKYEHLVTQRFLLYAESELNYTTIVYRNDWISSSTTDKISMNNYLQTQLKIGARVKF